MENAMWSLPLGNEKVDFPAAMKEYNRIRCFWVKRSKEARQRFLDEVFAKATTLDDNFFSAARYNAETVILENEIKELAEIVASAGKYEIDENIIDRDFHQDIYDYWEQALNAVWQQACTIESQKQYEVDYREAQKNNRSQVVGGGFGVSGMLQGMMVAGAVNAATGIAQSAVNAIGNLGSTIRAAKSRTELYQEAKEIFSDAIEASVYVIHLVHCKIMNVDVQPGMDYNKCRAILNNIQKGIIPQKDRMGSFCDCFQYDPYLEDIYKLYLEAYPDNEIDLQIIAEEFGIDLVAMNEEKHRVYSNVISDNNEYFTVKNISDVPVANKIVSQNDRILSRYINVGRVFDVPKDIDILDDFISECKIKVNENSSELEHDLYDAYLKVATPIMERAIDFLSRFDLSDLVNKDGTFDVSTVEGIDGLQTACHKIKYATNEQIQEADKKLNKKRKSLLREKAVQENANGNNTASEKSHQSDDAATAPDTTKERYAPSDSEIAEFEKDRDRMWIYLAGKIVFWFFWSAFLSVAPIYISISYIVWYIYRTFYKRFNKFRVINNDLPKDRQVDIFRLGIISLRWI